MERVQRVVEMVGRNVILGLIALQVVTTLVWMVMHTAAATFFCWMALDQWQKRPWWETAGLIGVTILITLAVYLVYRLNTWLIRSWRRNLMGETVNDG